MIELAMKVNTVRFGEIEVASEQVLEFPDGLVGLEGTEYVLVPAASGPFTWLQSLSDPGVALPLTQPGHFFPDFGVEVAEEDSERLGSHPLDAAEVFVTVRAAPDAADCTANLKAPILIFAENGAGSRQAYQVINRRAGVQLRTPLFAAA